MNGKTRVMKEMLDCYDPSAKSVVIPDNVREIGAELFSGWQDLEILTIGKNVEKISGRAFENCWRLKSLSIPESVKKFNLSAIHRCGLEKLTFEGPFRIIDFTFGYGDGLICYDELYSTFNTLDDKSLLDLIKYCPQACFSIPEERCNKTFLAKAKESVVEGMWNRGKISKFNEKVVDKDRQVLSALKVWFDVQLSPEEKLKNAIAEFNGKTKDITKE